MKFPDTLPFDKCAHFLAGQIIFLAVMPFFGVVIANACVLGIAFGKELVDSVRGGDVDLLDVAATLAGGLVTGLAVVLGRTF